MRNFRHRKSAGFLAFALVLIMAFSLVACGGKQPVTDPSNVVLVTPPPSEESLDGLDRGLSAANDELGSRSDSRSGGADDIEVSEKRISFLGVGDSLIHPNLYYFADISDGAEDNVFDFTVFFKETAPLIEAADIAFINQETLSGGDHLGFRGYPNFNTPECIIPQLESLGFDLVCLANNHVLDSGMSGIYHALHQWSKTDCVTSGINADEEMRLKIPTIERDGVKFAFLAYTTHTNGILADTDWRVNYMEEEAIRRDLKAARELADFVIVSAHWGWDDVFTIDDKQRYFAELFAECGADLVIGTGPHVIQHVEWYDRADGSRMLCAFSLGNYCSSMLSPFNELSGMLTLDFVFEPAGADADGSASGAKKYIDNVQFVPLVMHKEASDEVMNVYFLKDYTEELASRSSVNTYRGGLTLKYFYEVLYEQVDDEFIPDEYKRARCPYDI